MQTNMTDCQEPGPDQVRDAGRPDLSIFPPGTRREPDGTWLIGGCSVRRIAEEFGTPALVVDEGALRARAAQYLHAFRSRHPASSVYFATKAFPSASVISLLAEEGLGFDVASGNEFAMARAGGAAPGRMVLHGNAKTESEIRTALAGGIGHVVIDNLNDVERLADIATSVQPVLLRVTPGIGAHTHEATATGHVGSKFGVSMRFAPEVIERIQREPMLRLDGLHAHIGSQIFDLQQFREEVAALAELPRFGVYDLGGGLAARYTSDDPAADIDHYAQVLVDAVHEYLGTDVQLIVEPGRSLVGPVAVSLYSVVTVKRDLLTHVAVDGGMGDNLEVSLYGQRFQPWVLDRDSPHETCDLVGHHCESGDALARGVLMPRAAVGDLVAVPVTGAYTFTMSNNYNGALRPPVVLCRDGQARVGVRRETLQDLLSREVLVSAPIEAP